jgi:FAD/FMN-containing dehydrogenase
MANSVYEEALRTLRETFGDRIKAHPARDGDTATGGALASVLPMNAEEVQVLAEMADRYSVPLVALGAGTTSEPRTKKGAIVIRFDLMRRTRLPDTEEPWVEAEPGASWLQLDDNLRARGWGLAVYPTSAPRATVGGWLATDGLGVGSFEYGWLRENVLSAEVVLPEGERREIRGEELGSFFETGRRSGIVVGAKLRTRRADTDVPFGIVFGDPADLAEAVSDVFGASVPLWHLAFLSPEMARARNLGEEHLLFGAYPGERAAAIENVLRVSAASHRGRALAPADAYRVWGERFFPVAPSRPTPRHERALVRVEEISESLGADGGHQGGFAVQGTVARSGEVLLLRLDPCPPP